MPKVEVTIPEADPTLTDQPHMLAYYQLQRNWLLQVVGMIDQLHELEADGMDTDSLADRMHQEWEKAHTLMEWWADFSQQHTRILSPGPGVDISSPRLCLICRQRPPREPNYSELCLDCTVKVLTKEVS